MARTKKTPTHEVTRADGRKVRVTVPPREDEAEALARRIAEHPMNTPSDLAYFRTKGYSDAEILAFWDRDHGLGCQPVVHRPGVYSGQARDVLRDVLKDCLSPEAVAVLANAIHVQVHAGAGSADARTQLTWLAEQLVEMLGGPEWCRWALSEAGM